eukprot:3407957-Pleurochrysis_carterae.AAC.2
MSFPLASRTQAGKFWGIEHDLNAVLGAGARIAERQTYLSRRIRTSFLCRWICGPFGRGATLRR